MARVVLGCEALLEEISLLKGKRIGIVTNPTGVTNDLLPVWQVLDSTPGVCVSALFGPEHGLTGDVQDALPVEDRRGPDRRVPTYSLFGEHLKPTQEMLVGLDVLIFDIQDVGVRFYTYTTTMALCMQACAEKGIPFMVLDRPNPIGGQVVAGNILEPSFSSFLGLYAIPVQHGLTAGELAHLYNEEFGIDCQLKVVKLRGWRRSMWFDETGLDSWVMPSPNLPTLETAAVYPGMCFIEGTNISEGRGTTRPFELIGAPWIDGDALSAKLRALNLPGVKFRSTFFTPTFWKYAGELCRGVQIHVTDRKRFRAVEVGLCVIKTIRDMYPDLFSWRWDSSVDERCFFDLLAGTDKVRLALDQGVGIPDILRSWEGELSRFEDTRRKHLVYPE